MFQDSMDNYVQNKKIKSMGKTEKIVSSKKKWEMPSFEKLPIRNTFSGGTESEAYGLAGAEPGSGG